MPCLPGPDGLHASRCALLLPTPASLPRARSGHACRLFLALSHVFYRLPVALFAACCCSLTAALSHVQAGTGDVRRMLASCTFRPRLPGEQRAALPIIMLLYLSGPWASTHVPGRCIQLVKCLCC
jgi:hypothetical protein